MAGRIQGITVEIGGDTTKLQTALKGVKDGSGTGRAGPEGWNDHAGTV